MREERDDGVDEVAEDRIVAEGEPVKRFGAAAEEMTEGTDGVASLHGADLVDLFPPPCKVVWRGQGVCPCPDRKGHDSTRYSVDGGLPADVLTLLLQQPQHFALEGRSRCCLSTL